MFPRKDIRTKLYVYIKHYSKIICSSQYVHRELVASLFYFRLPFAWAPQIKDSPIAWTIAVKMASPHDQEYLYSTKV